MGMLTYHFEEVPLCIGTDPQTRKPLNIALISGTCDVTFDSAAWDFDAISVDSPIKDGISVPIRWVREHQTGRELWDWVSGSVMTSCGEAITEAVAAAREPDPDAKRDVERHY